MAELWTIFLIVLILIEIPNALSESGGYQKELPLTLSLGYNIRSNMNPNLADKRLTKEYMELYQKMVNVSRDSIERFDDEENQKLANVVGKERLQAIKKGILDRRRKVFQMDTAVGGRRGRSQATRREKLNSQSLRSHQEHTLKSSQAYHVNLQSTQ